MDKRIEIGSLVQYKTKFLQNIGVYVGNLPKAKGNVTALKNLGGSVIIATIEWDYPNIPEHVNVNNLERLKNA